MKRWLKKLLFSSTLIFLFTCALDCKAQVNLIKDGGFEDTITNWNWAYAYPLPSWEWFLRDTLVGAGIGSAVLFSTIATNSAYILPNGIFTIQPHGGFNAQELVTHFDLDTSRIYLYGWDASSMRTPIRTKLKTKLKAGKQYCATVYTSNQARTTYYNTNGIGMYFDNGQLDTVITKLHDSSGIYGRYCQAQVISYQVINDSANWTKIQGSFIANGTETYVTIGNWLTELTVTKVINGPLAYFYPQQAFSEYLIDDASVIPIDITTWLHDTTCVLGDSVWVGLDWRDYADGKWYNATMQYIKTGQGFWYKPTQAVTKFIQEIEVCGLLKYDTLTVYAYPLSVSSPPFKRWALQVLPNPASDIIQVSNVAGDKVGLYNAVGQLVAEQKVMQNKATIQVGHLPKGVYVVKTAGQVAKVVIR
jgi:Secretion system C-terminal sorting domain